MMFGGVNKTQYVGDMHEFNLATNKWWAVNFKSIMYKGKNIRTYSDKEAIGVVGTGTSMMAIPENLHTSLANKWSTSIGTKT